MWPIFHTHSCVGAAFTRRRAPPNQLSQRACGRAVVAGGAPRTRLESAVSTASVTRPRTASNSRAMASIRGSRYPVSTRPAIFRKLMPRSPMRDPSGTTKSAVTRISSSCSASRCGRNATSSLKAKPVRLRSSSAAARLVETFSGRKMVASDRKSLGTCDSKSRIPGPGALSEGPIARRYPMRRGFAKQELEAPRRGAGNAAAQDCDGIRASPRHPVTQSPPERLCT